jgi:ketosteroid isomerase-like protein
MSDIQPLHHAWPAMNPANAGSRNSMTTTPTTDTTTTVVQRFFESYQNQDRSAAEAIAGDEFVFTSPQDDHIDRATWFEKCFPTVGRVKTQEIIYLVAVSDEDVFLMYEYELKDGGTYRNTELITVRGGQVVESQVFFGGAVAG